MNKIDRDALKRAMEISRREPDRAGQLDSMLQDEPWSEVAEFAAYCAQSRALRLKPWETPPCSIDLDDDAKRDGPARMLLRRLLSAGLSRYEPDPMAALAVELQRELLAAGAKMPTKSKEK